MTPDAQRHIRKDSLRTSKPIVSYALYTGKIGVLRPVELIVEVDCLSNKRRSNYQNVIEREAFEPIDAEERQVEANYACKWAQSQWSAGSAPTDPRPPLATPRPHSVPPKEPELRVSSSGTGFLVGRSRLVTNFHVIDNCGALSIRIGADTLRAEVVAYAELQDLALLSISKSIGTVPSIRNSAALGEDVTVAGFPLAGLLSDDLVVTSGQVNSLAGLRNDPSMIQVSAPIQPGSSGGPLLDRSGAIVGVVVSKLNAQKLAARTGDIAQNVNFAIKPEVLRLFLDTNRVPYRSVAVGPRLEGVVRADRARQFTAQVFCLRDDA